MNKLRRRFPVLTGILLTVLFPLVSLVASLPLLLLPELWSQGEYLPQLVVELLMLGIMVLLSFLLGMGYIYAPSRLPLSRRILPALPIVVLYTFALLELLILHGTETPESPLRILWFVLCMLAVGVTEEVVFRGMITRMIFERYGATSVGVWLSVTVSSLLFGLVHLINGVGTADLGGVLIQMAGAAALGLCLAAVYLRSKSLWTVALLHGYMDFCALVPSGLFGEGSIEEAVSGYSAGNLVTVVLYSALALFLLRPSQMKRMTRPGIPYRDSELIGLMVAVMLLSGLMSMVTALSL